MRQPNGPLTGIRVIETGSGHTVLALGRLLLDLGADVIPVGYRREPETTFDRWLCLRDHPVAHIADVIELLPTADVLIYDETAEAALAARSVTATTLAANTPNLVAVRLGVFGMTGPLAGTTATDAVLQALAGLTHATGGEADPPLCHRLPLAGRTAALSGLLALTAALIGRDRGAGGDHFDIAEFDSIITHLGTLLPSVALTGAPPRRGGNRHRMASPWNSYPCADAHIVLCTMGQPMWHRLATVIGQPNLPSDPRFADSVARVRNVEDLDTIISCWTARKPAQEAIAALRRADVPCALAATPDDVRRADLTVKRGLVTGPHRMPHGPMRSLVPRQRPGTAVRRQGGLWNRLPAGTPPLRGIRVLELGSYTAGPAAGRLLAQLGADVLKVEPPHGEGSRRLAQRIGPVGYLYFINNAGKRSCRVDLDNDTDRERFDDLIADADVLLTNLAADTLAGSGIDTEHVLARHDLVHCAITGHGKAGADRSFDTVIQAESGIMHIVGKAVGEPRRTAVSCADVLGAYLAAAATVLATYQRLRSGAGGGVDVALFDAAAWLTQQAWFGDGDHPVPYVLAADDGEVLVDPHDTNTPINVGPRSRTSVADVLEMAARASTPASPVLDVTAVVDHPQVRARNMIIEQSYGDTTVLNTGNHLRSLRRPVEMPSLAPVDQNDPNWPATAEPTVRGSR